MALTDLIKTAGKVLRASALGLAVQGCGGNKSKDFCSKAGEVYYFSS